MNDHALRSRILGIITLALPVACNSEGQSGSGGGGAAATGAAAANGGAGGSLPDNCYFEDVGVCCVDPEPECFTPTQIAELLGEQGGAGGAAVGGAGGAGGAGEYECPDYISEPFADCEWWRDPTKVNDTCCYTHEGGSCCGRPFIVGNVQRLAPIAARSDWSGNVGDAGVIDGRTRDALAREWLGDALLEHASIAAFTRFTLQLMQLGAPRDLVAASQRAALDELAHADACFAQAARFAGEPIGPGPLDVSGALAPASLKDIAVLAVIEGCVGETVAASLASTALAVAGDCEAVRALARIANDEADHAALAWRFVAWAIAQGGADVAVAVRNTFARTLADQATVDDIASDADVALLHHHGRLTPTERAAAHARALETVVRPCAEALLASRPSAPSFQRVHARGV